MIKLYKSAIHRNVWVANIPGTGWVVFPARVNGWEERQPARGLDPLYLRQVSPKLALDAGFPQRQEDRQLAPVA